MPPPGSWLLLLNALFVCGVLLWITLALDFRPVVARLREGAIWLGWRPLPNELPRLTGWVLVLGIALQRVILGSIPPLRDAPILPRLFLGVLFFQGMAAAAVLGRLRFRRIPVAEALALDGAPRRSDLLWGFGGYTLALPVVMLGNLLTRWIFESFGFSPEPQDVLYSLHAVQGVVAWLLVFLLVAGLVPLLEEILFRGVLFTWLAQVFGVGRGLALQAFLFGLVHNHASGLIGLTGLALLLGLLLLHTRRLWVCVAVHAVFNAISLANFLLGHGEGLP